MNIFINFMDYLRHVNTASIILAIICGGILGHERGKKKRPAGFRTHIVVCIGASMVMITNQYMSEILGLSTDASRMGAQVISGIGFLGVGTIINVLKADGTKLSNIEVKKALIEMNIKYV